MTIKNKSNSMLLLQKQSTAGRRFHRKTNQREFRENVAWWHIRTTVLLGAKFNHLQILYAAAAATTAGKRVHSAVYRTCSTVADQYNKTLDAVSSSII